MASLAPHTGNFIGEEGLLFLGFAYAYIFDDRTGIVDTDFSACVFEMKFLPPEQKEIEAWIIIAAAASALLFLSCLIFGLCKVNFMQFCYQFSVEGNRGVFILTKSCWILVRLFQTGEEGAVIGGTKS